MRLENLHLIFAVLQRRYVISLVQRVIKLSRFSDYGLLFLFTAGLKPVNPKSL